MIMASRMSISTTQVKIYSERARRSNKRRLLISRGWLMGLIRQQEMPVKVRLMEQEKMRVSLLMQMIRCRIFE